ncbi:LytTR family two component transcriptional regulator [Nitritalea halalkaliphila LW7]|uniref:LytTR family two component transcriptional regulator n=1 Tax=Nitritalea halalkaliphila LW7 TaxID=1189621 RepID=I5C091_9BACT|nr:LytTR family DNA-binding domain-containing protein [Nitritalea halalkaliphila]EIM75243.1 LytTR family two component transcriptional regulator [Nitritalea halalkaliphila LW7]
MSSGNLRAVVIDDEPMAIEIIKAHAAKVPFLQLEATFTDAIKGLDFLRQSTSRRPLVVFLDIKMPDLNGLDLASLLPGHCLLIFTTAYSEHALRSFELDALDYLLKPFGLPRFLRACQKARDYQRLLEADVVEARFLKVGAEHVRIVWEELLYVEVRGNYVHFFLHSGEEWSARMTLTELEQDIPASILRVHRSFMVNQAYVLRVERHQLTLKGGVQVPLSARYEQAVKRLLES